MRPPAPPKTRNGGGSTAPARGAGAVRVAVLQQVGAVAGLAVALPRLDDPPLHVEQVGGRGVSRCQEGVALAGPRRVVEVQPELDGRRLALVLAVVFRRLGVGT